MKAVYKCFISLAILPCCVLIVIAIVVVELLYRAPDVATKSPSGQYLIESVPAASFLTSRDFVYLRFTDLNNPDQVYRTPLFLDLEVDMNTYEDKKTVGIVFVDFDKSGKTFKLGLTSLEKHWVNFFISNTPYTTWND